MAGCNIFSRHQFKQNTFLHRDVECKGLVCFSQSCESYHVCCFATVYFHIKMVEPEYNVKKTLHLRNDGPVFTTQLSFHVLSHVAVSKSCSCFS